MGDRVFRFERQALIVTAVERHGGLRIDCGVVLPY